MQHNQPPQPVCCREADHYRQYHPRRQQRNLKITPLPFLLLLLLLLDCNNNNNSAVVAATTFPTPSSLHKLSILSAATSSPVCDTSTISWCHSSSASLFLVSQLLQEIRGGGGGGRDYDDSGDDDDELYDEYDSELDDDDSQLSKTEYDRSLIDPPTSRSRPRPRPRPGYNSNSGRRGRGRGPIGSSDSSSLSSASSWTGASLNAATAATKLATKSISMTGSLAWNALVKQPGKLAYHVIRPKHVDLFDTYGLWRLDQQVVEKSNKRGGDPRTVASVATIEFVRGGPPKQQNSQRRRDSSAGRSSPPLVVVRRSKNKQDSNDKGGSSNDDDNDNVVVYRAPYTFVRKNKLLKGASLSSFQTSFVAPAFLIGEDQTRMYGYKGTWQRKLADKSVIKLVGKIYQVHKQKFGKKRGEYVFGTAVGTFVMRRRITMSESENDGDDDDDYDQYDDDEEDYTEFDSDNDDDYDDE
ncbi:hypothetical protein FRACYDRAFT_242269 [Fragilariopsis cylindrus CCMP1102]|uniref:Uncharacterized protein n=1 Tax=Fragilariopsis cylindrus CCMP1102 TaxID=635003 RepID=A0A1E7F7C1_9STRA|nr:hypothetical protein FRACYDRAFT_242269 [Fragilariopsis cylindrus CCMP1102]|eukprot:OEU13915.1 hypothetical protein FRACYDRAFT_242269 [Fragilariopsis cylindrus CCMP1102]